MKWFKEHRTFSIIGGIILALCLVIVVSYLNAGGGSIIGKGIQKTMSVIGKPVTGATSGIKNSVSSIFASNKIQKENEELKGKIEELERENLKLALTEQELADLQSLSAALNYNKGEQPGKIVSGKIIQIDLSKPYVVFTINIGEESGIKKENTVVDGNGIVGKVLETGKDWSKVVSILSDNNNISFKTVRDGNVAGVLKGNGKDKLEGYLIDENLKIIKGDILVSSGVGFYPEGIKIGKVSSVDYDENRQLKIITVKPTVNFKSMQKVAVIT